jgi:GNAT superfamily N-acetyltransferase
MIKSSRCFIVRSLRLEKKHQNFNACPSPAFITVSMSPPSESSVLQEFEAFRHSPGFIDVPLRLWVPDEEAVAFAWAGRLHNVVLGRTSLTLREGLLPGRFRGRFAQGPQGRKRQARTWVNEIPMLGPTDLLHLIRDGLDGAAVAARTEFTRDGRFDLTLAIGDAHSHKAVALVERRFSLKDSSVEHHWLRVVKSSQNQGFGAHVIGALLPLYEALAIYQIRLTAGLSAGGAVWGKFGFAPDPTEWTRIQPTIRANIAAVMAGQGLPQAIREMCEAAHWLAGDSNPKNLWLISDLAGKQGVGGVRLGTLLLRNVRWRGSLSFADPEAVNRLRDRLSLSGVGSSALDSLAAAASRG